MKTSSAAAQPWDRREGETPKAFRAFCIYRELGPSRSLAAAYHRYRLERDGGEAGEKQGTDLPKAPSYFELWCSKHEWVRRTEAWDAHVDREARDRAADEYVDWLRDFQRRRMETARRLQKGVQRGCELLLERLETLEASEIEPGDLNKHLRALVALDSHAAESEQEALGISRIIEILEEHDKL